MRSDTTIQRETDIRQKILLHKLTAVEFEVQMSVKNIGQ